MPPEVTITPVRYLHVISRRLVEGVGAGSPVGEEERETDGLHTAGESTDGNGVERALLGEDLGDNLTLLTTISRLDMMTYRRSSRGEEDQRAEVSSALVGEGTSGIDESTDTVGLDGGADERATPRGSGGGSLLGVEVLLLGVGGLRAAVGVAEDGAKHGQGDGVVEGGAQGNGRGLDGREVWRWKSQRWPRVDDADGVVVHQSTAIPLGGRGAAAGEGEGDLQLREAIVMNWMEMVDGEG
jgi:hypothetical protein